MSENFARAVIEKVGVKIFKIPPHSSDLNPNENFFNIITEQLESDAITNNITHENFEAFVEQVHNTMLNYSFKKHNKIIDSMPNRTKQTSLFKILTNFI